MRRQPTIKPTVRPTATPLAAPCPEGEAEKFILNQGIVCYPVWMTDGSDPYANMATAEADATWIAEQRKDFE